MAPQSRGNDHLLLLGSTQQAVQAKLIEGNSWQRDVVTTRDVKACIVGVALTLALIVVLAHLAHVNP